MKWKIKRGDSDFEAPDQDTLQAWAREGRVLESDYIYNHILERWIYARESAELAGVFEVKRQSVNRKTGCSVSILGALLCILFWPLGIIVLAAGLIMWGVAEAKGGK